MSLPPPLRASTVVVTGASSGIGAELARALGERGYNLALVARRRNRLRALARELRATHGVLVDIYEADISRRAVRTKLVTALDEGGRTVVGLCNNAGRGSFGLFCNLDPEDEGQIVRLNVNAVHGLTAALLPRMLRGGSGAILNVGSVAGAQPIPGNATYSATKAFVNSFSEALHAELRGTGVSCTLVAPGPVPTEFAQRARREDLERRVPDAAMVPPEEVARQAVEGMVAGHRLVIPGVQNQVAYHGGRLAPRSVLLPALRALSKL